MKVLKFWIFRSQGFKDLRKTHWSLYDLNCLSEPKWNSIYLKKCFAKIFAESLYLCSGHIRQTRTSELPWFPARSISILRRRIGIDRTLEGFRVFSRIIKWSENVDKTETKPTTVASWHGHDYNVWKWDGRTHHAAVRELDVWWVCVCKRG